MSQINAARLRAHLEALSEIGRPPGGGFDDGVTRLGYSDADRAARAFVVDLMRRADLDVRIDEAANIVGRRAGTSADTRPILFGSHVDSVPRGGNFDGPLGTLAAIEVVQSLDEDRIRTSHPLEVVVWTNEEGVAYGNGLDGSRAVAGELLPGELEDAWNGVRKADAIDALGGDAAHIDRARRAAGSILAYLELHIEQGAVLDRLGVPIGVVEGIVSIDRYEAVVRGVANHAGTTPMADRRDALLAASALVQAVHRIATADTGRQVGTVGRLEVSPNAPNVVPGQVTMTIEWRDLSADKLRRLSDAVHSEASLIADATRTRIDITATNHHEAALADARVQEAIAASAARLGLAFHRMPCGAGHDAQMVARLAPMGMIFVPSAGGISHSPRERTAWEHCANGANVLLHTVLAVDGWTMP